MYRSFVVFAVAGLTAALAACGSSGGPVQAAPSAATSTASGTGPALAPAAVTAPAPVTASYGAGSPVVAASTSTGTTPAVAPTPRTSPFPFATPQAAMRYLASAYNRHDARALRSVTTPIGRDSLLEMRSEAVNLRLTKCEHQPAGDYLCWFVHDYPRAMKKPASAHGEAVFTVAPAVKQGWYMTVLLSCG